MNPRTRRAALHAIAAIAVLASLNALAHSYAGLYQWAIHHRMSGWQAFTWPAEIDVFLILGELALYVAYLDAWTTRHKIWPWATALLGLAVSVAGNIGHLPARAGAPVPTVDRLTAATSPLAAFAGLAIALLVLRQTKSGSTWRRAWERPSSRIRLAPPASAHLALRPPWAAAASSERQSLPIGAERSAALLEPTIGSYDVEPDLIREAGRIQSDFEARGVRLSRRQLARRLRARGHTVSNARLPEIAKAIGLP